MRRSIQFYRIAQKDGSDLAAPFAGGRVVHALIAAKRRGLRRHRTCRDGVELLAQGLGNQPHPHLAMYRTRRTNLPRLEDAGDIAELQLTNSQALAEVTYAAFLPRNILAVVFNNEGPRPNRLADYLNAKMACGIRLLPIYRDDLAEVLDNMRLSSIKVAIPEAQVPMLSRNSQDDWAESLDTARRLLRGGVIHLDISVGRRGKKEEKEGRRRNLGERLRELRGHDLTRFNSAKVDGKDLALDEQVTVDLLEQRFIARVDVAAEELTTVKQATQTMIGLLDGQYRGNRSFLERATPDVTGEPDLDIIGTFVEHPPDEQLDDEL